MTIRKKFTAIVTEQTSPFPPVSPWPLIYTVELENAEDNFEAMRQIARMRCDEMGTDNDQGLTEEQVYQQILEGLDLHFVFEGDLSAAADWRN